MQHPGMFFMVQTPGRSACNNDWIFTIGFLPQPVVL
jgi:hypothetical protein